LHNLLVTSKEQAELQTLIGDREPVLPKATCFYVVSEVLTVVVMI
jgi:hypothetical protein